MGGLAVPLYAGSAGCGAIIVLFLMVGPLSPYSDQGGAVPWFKSESKWSLVTGKNILGGPSVGCPKDKVTDKVSWSMYGTDESRSVECEGGGKPRTPEKDSATRDYGSLCHAKADDGVKAFCSKRGVALTFAWIGLINAILLVGSAVFVVLRKHKQASMFAVGVAVTLFICALLGMATGVSCKMDLEEHLKHVNGGLDTKKYTDLSYSVENAAGMGLMVTAWVLSLIAAGCAIFGFLKLRAESKEEESKSFQSDQEAPPVQQAPPQFVEPPAEKEPEPPKPEPPKPEPEPPKPEPPKEPENPIVVVAPAPPPAPVEPEPVAPPQPRGETAEDRLKRLATAEEEQEAEEEAIEEAQAKKPEELLAVYRPVESKIQIDAAEEGSSCMNFCVGGKAPCQRS